MPDREETITDCVIPFIWVDWSPHSRRPKGEKWFSEPTQEGMWH